MSKTPENLRFTESHEWVEQLEDGTLKIGITSHAQELLGDIVFVELPELDRSLSLQEGFAVIESVKSASDVYAPVAGKVVAVNSALMDKPDLVNESAFGEGWLIQLAPENFDAEQLLTADAYEALISR